MDCCHRNCMMQLRFLVIDVCYGLVLWPCVMCYGLTEAVECQTQLKWAEEIPKRDFSLLAIAESETTPRSYRLLPRTLNNDAWLDSTFMNKQVSLFSSKSLDHLGLRVIEEDCFNRIVSIFCERDSCFKIHY